MVVVVIIVLILFVAALFALTSLRNKIANKVTKTVMRETGLGNKLNEHFDAKNAEAVKRLDAMLAEGKITQEQYEKRKQRLLNTDYDFNE